MGEERDSDVMHVEYLIEPGLACMVTLVGVVLGSSTWPSTPPSEVFELVRGARSWQPELNLDESCSSSDRIFCSRHQTSVFFVHPTDPPFCLITYRRSLTSRVLSRTELAAGPWCGGCLSLAINYTYYNLYHGKRRN